ncbi:MAG: NADH-quinone oxidoreductase subunit K [Desulfurococcales archaeon]|nr:NADH-quinone oxidoreductase subunit K [Desulfurococcales archaeon]
MGFVDAATAGVTVVTASVIAGLAVYGMSSSRNFLRQMLSIEVLFNAILLVILVIAGVNPAYTTAFAILLVSVVSGEVIVLVSIIVAFYRVARELDSTAVEEEGV